MARDRRLIDVATDELLEALCLLERALADGRLEGDAAARVLRQLRRALQYVEQANVAELAKAALLREGGVNPYLRQRARMVGLWVEALVPDVEAA